MLYKTPAQGVCHGFGFYPIHSRSLTGAALRQAHRGSLRLLDSLLYPFSQQGTPLTLDGEAIKQFLEFLTLKRNEVRDLNSSTAQVS